VTIAIYHKKTQNDSTILLLGRTYELVDQLASETEYYVILPDFFRGVENPPFTDFEWETVVKVSSHHFIFRFGRG
jgi:hypothetical protein